MTAIIPLPVVILRRVRAEMLAEDELEINVSDVEALKLIVPTGKIWELVIKVHIEERDA